MDLERECDKANSRALWEVMTLNGMHARLLTAVKSFSKREYSNTSQTHSLNVGPPYLGHFEDLPGVQVKKKRHHSKLRKNCLIRCVATATHLISLSIRKLSADWFMFIRGHLIGQLALPSSPLNSPFHCV